MQHELLVDLEATGNDVYYAAPCFHRLNELNVAYSTRQVFSATARFSLADIGNLPGSKEHYIVFQESDSTAYFCSKEPFKLAAKLGREYIKNDCVQSCSQFDLGRPPTLHAFYAAASNRARHRSIDSALISLRATDHSSEYSIKYEVTRRT
jgi:hypothetical protein